MDSAVSLYERAIDEGCSYGGINILKLLLQNGADRVEKDVDFAKSLSERALSDILHFGAMNNLAGLLEKVADGVEYGVTRALFCYNFGTGRCKS